MSMSNGSPIVADECASPIRPRHRRGSGCLFSRSVSRGRASSDSFQRESSQRSIEPSQPTLQTIKSESFGLKQEDGLDELPNDMGHQPSIEGDAPSRCTSCHSVSDTTASTAAYVQDVDNMNAANRIENDGCMTNVGNVSKTFIAGPEGALDVLRQDKNEAASRITELEKENVDLRNKMANQKSDYEQKMTRQRERYEKEKHEREIKQKESEHEHLQQMAKIDADRAIAMSRDETKKEEVKMAMLLQQDSNAAELEKLKCSNAAELEKLAISNKAVESNMLKQAEIDAEKLEQERQAEKELNDVRRAHEEEMQRRQHAHESRLSLVGILREIGASIAGVFESIITCGPDQRYEQ